MREANVDTIVLGCTHYPLAKEAIADVMQKEVCFLDAGEAIANRVKTLLNTEGKKGKSRLHIMVTGSIDEEAIKRIVPEYGRLKKLTIPRKIPNS
jgi:glutamate racemase